MAQRAAAPLSEREFNRSVTAMRSTWARLTQAESREKDGGSLRDRLAATERRAVAADAERAKLQEKLGQAETELERTREELARQTARADLEQRKFANLAGKLGILDQSKSEPTRASSGSAEQRHRRQPPPQPPPQRQSQQPQPQPQQQQIAGQKRQRDPATSSSEASSSDAHRQRVPRRGQPADEDGGDARPRAVARLDDERRPTAAATAAHLGPSSPTRSRPAAPRPQHAGRSSDPYPGAVVDMLNSAVGQSAPHNMARLIDSGLLPRATRVFQGQGAQLARDKHAQASGHRCMLAYGLPSGGGNCYLSFPDQLTFAKVYHNMLLQVADTAVVLEPHVRLDDICFYEQLYLPCSWYFDVEEEASGAPLEDLSKQMIHAIREAARGKGLTDLGVCSVTDGSREPKDKRGYKNSLHLVFRKSPVCPQPTSNASAPDYPPLLAAQQVHSTLDVQDSKGAKQPDIGVYTTRRNMRLVGSCKVGQPVPLVPQDVFPHKTGFSRQLWMDWLKTATPEDLLQFMISRDDGTTEPNWQTAASSTGGGPRRTNGDADNWDLLGPAPGGVMSQAAAGMSPVADNRMPALKAWVGGNGRAEGDDREPNRSRGSSSSSGGGGGGGGGSAAHHAGARGGRDRGHDSRGSDGRRGDGSGDGSFSRASSNGRPDDRQRRTPRSVSPSFDGDEDEGGDGDDDDDDDDGFDAPTRRSGSAISTIHRQRSSSSSDGRSSARNSGTRTSGSSRSGSSSSRSSRSGGSRSSRDSRTLGRSSSDGGGGGSRSRRHNTSDNRRRSGGSGGGGGGGSSSGGGGAGGSDRSRSGNTSGNSGGGSRPQHRSMTRQAFDAPSPPPRRGSNQTSNSNNSGGGGGGGGGGGNSSWLEHPQQLAVTTMDPVQQRIMRHQNHNGVVRNQVSQKEREREKTPFLRHFIH